MFYALLGATLLVALVTSLITAKFFDGAVGKILSRIVGDELADAWRRYLRFAVIVVGVSGGVRLWELEKYVTATRESAALELNGMRWTLELYRTLIETLQSIAWMMLLFFLCSMIAYVIVRAIELKHDRKE
ncbi:hypothetical protein [Craterilacuibacter sinensis]|uniref:Uncharacterized protein n=1 Tax=Craterilacuibacter sinensis TaxID=2686017 RepID=A0A845BK62_9NEIS|nr:hypothetical protein [Craterilacuibacter sinensis]MXR36589.1 hypothetical protein [Craterilacuibacter sinensis]RQW19689.1 hypothetical protein EHS17_15185 [Rhodobacteraceae bacterium CH30]